MFLDPHSPDPNIITLFEEICRELDLNDTQRAEITRSYESVGDWLIRDGSSLARFDPKIYPQGSFLVGTTVKPVGRYDFDVDLVCLLATLCGYSSEQVYNMVWKRLAEHESYVAKMSRKNRCIRIQHSEYHLDITPAIPSYNGLSSDGMIYVPDRALRNWKDTFPKGYAAWFRGIAAILPKFGLYQMENRRIALSVEPLPDESGFYQVPLNRIVQLLKRHRDIFFERSPTHQVISIIIGTLAAQAYKRTVAVRHESVYEMLKAVVVAMPEFIEFRKCGMTQEWVIQNPVISTENFAEKWNEDPKLEPAFRDWHRNVMELLVQIEQSRGRGFDELIKPVIKLAGERVAKKAAIETGKRIGLAHNNRCLNVGRGGLISAAGVPVPRTTYFGT